jgi:AraC-like DNA-binding protein
MRAGFGVVGTDGRLQRPWSQRVGAFSVLPGLIRQFGADPDATLLAAGLDPSALSHPERRIPYTALLNLLHEAGERTACPHFGLLVGQVFRFEDFGILGQLVRNSPTVGRALEALTVHQHINSEGGLAFLLRRGDMVELGYAIYHPGVAGTAHMYDATIAAAMNVMTTLCGPEWRASEVLLARVRPRDAFPHRAFFKVMPHFDAEYSALRFPATDLARIVADADPERLGQAELLARRAGPPTFLQQVYRTLRRLMLENRHGGDDLAQTFAMHRRTLNRRLKAHGTTFQHVLDEVRFEIARDLLQNTGVRLDDIAATLGYSAVSPFMRTFRRWSGSTPGQWRREQGMARQEESAQRLRRAVAQ